MKALIISDLHIGAAARCLSMVPKNEQKPKAVDEALVQRLYETVKKNHPEITYIIVAGDIADRASYEQYTHFDVVLKEIQHKLSVPDGKVLYTPGNHDVDWHTLKAENADLQNKGRWKSRYAPIKESHVLKTSSQLSKGELFDGHFFEIWNFDDLIAVSINTASKDDPSGENHPGEISEETLDAISLELNHNDYKKNCPRLLIIHHHPVQYENIFKKWKDFSILQCSSNLIEFCSKSEIDFIVHGHRHQPHFKQEVSSNGHVVNVLASGSLSHNFPSYVYDSLSNHFHILDICDRDPATNTIMGKIFNYAFSQTKGWQPSRRETDGIHAKIPFGNYLHFRQLARALEEKVKIAINQKGVARIRDVLAELNVSEYQSPETINAAFVEICRNLSAERFGDDVENSVIIPGAKS